MKTNQFISITILFAFGLQNSANAQGSLTPPGPPAATMLTLSQIEPRTPVDAVHTPGNSTAGFIINQPGSYYLTTNIVSTNFYGIEISANNATLDLNGFSLTGNSGAQDGILINFGFSRIRVFNGMVSGWTNSGIVNIANDVVLEHLAVSDNLAHGVVMNGALGSILRDSTVSRNGQSGVFCQQCSPTLENLFIFSNNSAGIDLGSCGSGVVRDCTVDGNKFEGVGCFSSTNVNLENLNVSYNNGIGVEYNGGGSSTISDCVVSGNSQYGIEIIGSGCLIIGNNCAGNNLLGIRVGSNNRIENNHVTGSSAGISAQSPGTNNIVIKNSVEGCASDYVIDTNQIVGPIITNTVSGIISSSNPWSNFAF
jgi:parallel beta-helix repeat protein